MKKSTTFCKLEYNSAWIRFQKNVNRARAFMGNFLCGVERVKLLWRSICIASISEMSTLPPLEKFLRTPIRDEHGSGLDQDESHFWPDQDWIGLQFLWKLADQNWIGLSKFLCFYVIILNISKLLVVIRFYRVAKWQCIFCHQWQKLCWDYFAIRTVSTFVHI